MIVFGMNLASLFLVASLFSLPISTTGKSICLSLALLALIAPAVNRAKILSIIPKLWCQGALLLFVVAVLANCWSPAPLHDKFLELSKYCKLLYLPILVFGFREKRVRMWAMNAFLAAMLVTCVVSVAKALGWTSYHGTAQSVIFRNHIMTSYMMATAAYLSAFLCIQLRHPKHNWSTVVYALLFIVYTLQLLFINTGRTGYVIYLLLMLLLALQIFSGRQALVATLILLAGFGLSYQFSGVMQTKVQQTYEEIKFYQQSKNTSLGYRFQFHQYAYDLFKRHPWWGQWFS